MSRPERRKSSLVGESPVAPVRDVSRVDQPASTPAAGKPSAAGEKPDAKPKYPPKVSFYQDPADSSRLRAAYRHTLHHSSDRSLSDFINRVVMAEVERLETVYNNGQPFPSVGAGELPQGRPLGE